MQYKERISNLLEDNKIRLELQRALDTFDKYHIFNYLREAAGDILVSELTPLQGSGLTIKGSLQTIKALETLLDKKLTKPNKTLIQSTYGVKKDGRERNKRSSE